MRPATRLRELIADGRTHFLPGAYDGLSARIVEAAGASALYATGGGIARSFGIPDMGLLSVKEITDRLEQIVDAVAVPVVADMDTGYGNALNAARAARAFERAGVAGFHLEDQVFPKRCGHLEGKRVVGADEFCAKLRAVRDALGEDDVVVIARTDAIAVEGFDAAMARMHRYVEAGADVAFVEAPRDLAQIERVARELECPKLLNMFWGGKTPIVDRAVLERLGYELVIVPGDLQRGAIRAMRTLAETILRDGHTESLADAMATFDEREAAVDTPRWMALDERYES